MSTTIHFIRAAFGPYGYVGKVEVSGVSEHDSLNRAFAAFNRGSGEEVEFNGPSASVGDLFVVEDTKSIYKIASFGFTPLTDKNDVDDLLRIVSLRSKTYKSTT